MDEQWKGALERFSRVWPRVDFMGPPPPPPEGYRPPPPPRPGPPPPPPPPPGERETGTLAELIRLTDEIYRRYRSMAGRAGRSAAPTLRRLAGDAAGLERRLQREYFLRTGDTLSLRQRPAGGQSMSQMLRRAWRAAGEAERAFSSAAGDARDPGLRELYRRAAELFRRQKQSLEALADRMLR